MPRGAQPGERRGGRAKGTKNKTTIERELKAQRDAMAAEALADPEVQAAVAAIPTARAGGRRIGKEILDDFANVLAGMAAAYQPIPPGQEDLPLAPGRKPNEEKFLRFATLALYAAEKVSQYQSPKLSAVMVGTAQTRKIEVVGGLPTPETPPMELPPDMEADSFKVIESKVEVNK